MWKRAMKKALRILLRKSSILCLLIRFTISHTASLQVNNAFALNHELSTEPTILPRAKPRQNTGTARNAEVENADRVAVAEDEGEHGKLKRHARKNQRRSSLLCKKI
jgi:hypothetical protein